MARPVAHTLLLLLSSFILLFSAGCGKKPPPPVAIAPPPPFVEPEEVPTGEPMHGPLKDARIVVRKSDRKLLLYSEERLLRAYPVKLGYNPVDDKVRQGDKCTPEGSFYVCQKNPRSRYHLSLGLSYPNIDSAERGLRDGLINQNEYDLIVDKIRQRAIPPWNTKLGGEIFIHGDAEEWDWTYGCVALNNPDIEELFRVIGVGTEVIIQK
ncbi:MAG: L,D-transpeptidase family protein [Thermodesulfobacteriota bacterium]